MSRIEFAQKIDRIVLIVFYFALAAAIFGTFAFDIFGFAARSFMGPPYNQPA